MTACLLPKEMKFLQMKSALTGKCVLLRGATSFPYELTHTEKEGKNEVAGLLLPECLSIHFNLIALRKAKIVYNFGLSECNRVKSLFHLGFGPYLL